MPNAECLVSVLFIRGVRVFVTRPLVRGGRSERGGETDQSLPMNGFVRLRSAPTDVGDYNHVGADVSPRTCPIRPTARVHWPHAAPLWSSDSPDVGSRLIVVDHAADFSFTQAGAQALTSPCLRRHPEHASRRFVERDRVTPGEHVLRSQEL